MIPPDNRCCFCLSLRLGVIIIGLVNFALYTLAFSWSVIYTLISSNLWIVFLQSGRKCYFMGDLSETDVGFQQVSTMHEACPSPMGLQRRSPIVMINIFEYSYFLNARYIGTVGINAELDELEVSNLDISVFVVFCLQVSVGSKQ